MDEWTDPMTYFGYLPYALAALYTFVAACRETDNSLWSEFKYLTKNILGQLIMAIFVGVSTYLHLALGHRRYIPDWDNGYRQRMGLHHVVAICTSALAFTLVFRVSRARGRWWEARSHIGKIVSGLKIVVINVYKSQDAQLLQEIVDLAKLFVECMRTHLHSSPAVPWKELIARVHNRPGYEYYERQMKKETTDEDEDDTEDEEDETASLTAIGTKQGMAATRLFSVDETRQFEAAGTSGRVLLVWKKLYLAAGRRSENQQTKQLDTVLIQYYGAGKIKAHGAEESGIDVIEWIVMHVLLTFLFPISLAYEFHTKWTTQDLEAYPTLNVGYLLLYVSSVALIVGFFCTLKVVAKDAQDPYGTDSQDIPLNSITKTFMTEIDLVSS